VHLVTTAFYLGIPVFYGLYTTSAAEGGASGALWWSTGAIIGASLILLSIDRLEYWVYGETTPAGAALLLLASRMVFIEIIAQLDDFKFSPFLYFIPPLMAVLYFGDGLGYALAALVWTVYVAKHVLNSPGWLSDEVELQYFIIFTLGLVFSIAMAQVVNRERASHAQAERALAELAASHQQLKEYTEQAVELAATKERNRLAREIHDSLGHYLTVINVQLEKALVVRDQHPQQADQAVRDAKGLASEALQDVRRSVGELRATNESFSLPAALGTLIERMQSDDLTIELRVSGREEGFPEEGRMALFRATQEGLTNIHKHAAATHARIDLRFGEQDAVVDICDNGHGFDPATLRPLAPGRAGGYGLQGMRERLELLGGRFQIESAPGAGTRLTLRVPKALRPREQPAP
jgi:signal transduction histidine kinase